MASVAQAGGGAMTIQERLQSLTPQDAIAWLSETAKLTHLPAEQFAGESVNRYGRESGVIHCNKIGLQTCGKWTRYEVPSWILRWRDAMNRGIDARQALEEVQ